MAFENGVWIMCGTNSPDSIHNIDELTEYVDRVGFLPLFKNDIAGFSVEENTSPDYWWTDDKERDPWLWREYAARSGKAAYGKFFGKKAGFISLRWLPYFVNYRRDGYDFDTLIDEGLAPRRERLLMELFNDHEELPSYELKSLGGFGRGGEKNFSGIVTELQSKTYLVIKDFRRRLNKRGEEYGMSAAVYAPPEKLYGYDLVSSAYGEEPSESAEHIITHMHTLYPDADEKALRNLCL